MTTPLFDITAIAVDRYENFPPLDGVIADAEAIAELLGQVGGVRSTHAKNETWHEAAVKARLRAWTQRDTPSSLLIWLGHGDSNGDKASLACYDTVDPVVANGFNALSMADQLDVDWGRRQEHDAAWALVIVEACSSGDYVKRVAAMVRDDVRQLYLIGVSGDAGAYVGELRQAFGRALARLTPNDEHVVLDDLIHELLSALPDARPEPRQWRRVLLPRARPVAAAVSAPLDVYEELMALLATVPDDQRNHFFPKFWATERVDTGLHFVGRTEEARDIRAWLRSADRGMLVITGRPGSGKSALLGSVLIRSSPLWQPILARFGWTGEPWDDAGPFDTALNLSGLSIAEIVERLTESFGLKPAAEGAGWSGADVDHLIDGLTGRRFTILVDGLDEATDPVAVAGSVLRRLAAQPHGRVLVGTRASVDDQVDGPPPVRPELITALGPAHLRRLGRDRAALAAYVLRRLTHLPHGQRPELTDDEIGRVADLITRGRDDMGFLFARLVVHEVLADPGLVRSQRLTELVSGDHRAVFRHALSRLDRTTPHARALLRVLAFTVGPGMPRSENLWAGLAGAFTDGHQVTEADIDLLLERAAPYVTVDAEYGISVYRLAHQTYRAALEADER
ncbi:hypothetical protein [Actinoplanes sp. CA-252034]|uniref:hypothetical protein n=1 Tax=Actinoplanes sp. CA-252034 TaxID=3239906 RepID=UPI003D99A10C